MRDHTPWLRLLGGVWFATGLVGLLWSITTLWPDLLTDSQLLGELQPVQAAFGRYTIEHWAQAMVGTAGLAMLLIGWGLIGRKTWVQTIVVPAHWSLVLYGLVGAIVVYLARDRTATGWVPRTSSLGAVALVNLLLAAYTNSKGAREALAWFSLRTSPALAMTCEFCGTPLDQETGRCPECAPTPEMTQQRATAAAPPARLIDVLDESEHWLNPGKVNLIGRGLRGNDVNLLNPTVSRHHAQIEYREGHYLLTALQDANGTFVNDVRTRRRVLRDGEEIRFGKARYRFQIVEPQRTDALW
jgi:uncharacterized Zn finger protein (UPF0148 family)